MAATVLIREWVDGNTANAVDKTSGAVRYKNANNATVDAQNPLVRPANGFVYSYEKWIRLKITVPPTGAITSPVLYSDGANGYGTGVSLYCGRNGAYVAAVNTISQFAVTNGADFFSYTNLAPMALDITNAGPFNLVGDIGDFAVLQARVASTATAGTTAGEVHTFSWNET